MSDCTRVAILSTMLVLAVYIAPATADVITFTSFPNGDPIPDGTVVSNQFEPLGVRFQPLFPDSPRVLSALGGVLISGGPTGFFGDIGIEFLTPISSVTVDIIGSGFDIAARLEAFNGRGLTLGAATHTYTGVTGLPSSFSFFAPDGDSIARVLFNGGLNPAAAASIDALAFTPTAATTPEPGSLLLLVTGVIGAGAWRRRCNGADRRNAATNALEPQIFRPA